MKKTNTLKGLKTPRILLFALGFLHGRAMKSAALDPESGRIRSSYITGRMDALNSFCAQQVRQMETDLKAVWAEADNLLLSLRMTQTDPAPTPEGSQRELAQAEARKQQAAAESSQKLKQLSDIHNKIRSREVSFWTGLDTAASTLRSKLSAYGHGVTLGPVTEDQIPLFTYDEHYGPYELAHEYTRRQLQRLLREV